MRTGNSMRVPLLLYHWFDDGTGPRSASPEFGVRPEDFRRQLDWLALAGRATVSLSAVGAALRGGPALPPAAVNVSFDDGYADFLDHALPALAARSMTATLFVVSSKVGGTNTWDARRGEPSRRLASWPQLREAVAAGVEVGSHSRTHADMRRLSAAELREECEASRREIEDALGVPVRHFAYPHGLHDARVKDAVRAAGYLTASAVLLRPRDLLRSDAFALMRVIVHGTRGLGSFRARLALAAPRHGAA